MFEIDLKVIKQVGIDVGCVMDDYVSCDTEDNTKNAVLERIYKKWK